MDLAHLQELIELEETYWWHRAKSQLVVAALLRWCPPPGRLVEGGVGGGGNLRRWRSLGYEVLGMDVLPEAATHCREALGLPVVVHDLQEPWPVDPQSVRAVVLLDVLEHLPEPARALAQAAQVLAPEGAAIVTVPALPGLRGPWDEALGHLRRYSPALLREQAAAAGLRLRWVRYWNSFCLPAAVPLRLWERRRGVARPAEFPRLPGFLNQALLAAAAVERAWLRCLPLPAGLSLLGVLTR
jgi:SAM-dependent methyltransferase